LTEELIWVSRENRATPHQMSLTRIEGVLGKCHPGMKAPARINHACYILLDLGI
jgi:hypothetical protein